MPAIRNRTLNTDHMQQCRRRRVADQRLVRPVVGVVTLATPFGPAPGRSVLGGAPTRSTRRRRSAHGDVRIVSTVPFLHRIAFAQRVPSPDRCRTGSRSARRPLRKRDRAFAASSVIVVVAGVVGVGAHHRLQAPAQRRPAARRRVRVAARVVVAARPLVEHVGRFAMQPVGAPVRRDVAAVAPDRTQLHAADRLPDLAALLDVGPRVDDWPSWLTTRSGIGGAARKISPPDPQQHGERGDEQGAPAPARAFGYCSWRSPVWTAHLRMRGGRLPGFDQRRSTRRECIGNPSFDRRWIGLGGSASHAPAAINGAGRVRQALRADRAAISSSSRRSTSAGRRSWKRLSTG